MNGIKFGAAIHGINHDDFPPEIHLNRPGYIIYIAAPHSPDQWAAVTVLYLMLTS